MTEKLEMRIEIEKAVIKGQKCEFFHLRGPTWESSSGLHEYTHPQMNSQGVYYAQKIGDFFVIKLAEEEEAIFGKGEVISTSINQEKARELTYELALKSAREGVLAWNNSKLNRKYQIDLVDLTLPKNKTNPDLTTPLPFQNI